jgi:alpha-N-arabinofuranosidase
VVKAVNYEGQRNTLLVRFEGTRVPEKAVVTLHTISAGLVDSASLEHPDAIAPVNRSLKYARDLTVELDPYTVAVLEIRAE